MSSSNSISSSLKLSICITTFNRARLIGETIESILGQLTPECELLVLDAASSDDTRSVISEYSSQSARLRYVRQATNGGIDRDYDSAVQFARGEYCWLMSDDDLLKPGAVAAVLGAIREDFSLVIVNPESRDFTMSRILQDRWLAITVDQVYERGEVDRLFSDLHDALKYIGCVVIKREIWLSRDRQRYYDSLWIHIGVIFQEMLPGRAIIIAQPLISYRWGNGHTWTPRLFEALMITLPSLVWSLPISEPAKVKLCSARPWLSFPELIYCRARGCYSLEEFRRWVRPRLRSIGDALIPIFVLLLPGILVNAIFVLYFAVSRQLWRGMWKRGVLHAAMRASHFHYSNWRIFKHV